MEEKGVRQPYGRRNWQAERKSPFFPARVEGQNCRQPVLASHGIPGREPTGFVVAVAGRMGELEPIFRSYGHPLALTTRTRSFGFSPPQPDGEGANQEGETPPEAKGISA
ncbi:hypothetical protein [Candidatus Methylacidithermus pantelleriae]|uniref:Uncharacterized protein n=1 Tax=Candidatus Methylacidithermus pantelleriae TaxID=2744239 RepID=A0A8J2FT94_9BACT|nr:hypothetical protein [Candidatus Methylacidithermus pantelleriae]CAF0700981.1 hypothetical protein MPNT_40097 [Candidatus Methylacidithermus pantelleriae]